MIVAGLSLVAGACSKGDAMADVRPTGLAFADPGTTVADFGGTLRLGVVGIDSLDPVRANPASPSSMLVADLLYDGLTGYDPKKGAVVGVLARSWGVSADGLTWTFEIDPAMTFADGSPIQPADVKASIERVATRGDASVSGVRLAAVIGYDEFVHQAAREITGITGTGATIQFHLRAPYAALPELLADPAFGVVKAGDVSATGFAALPVGSGPFGRVTRNAATLSLTRSPGSRARLAKVEVTVFADSAAAYAAFGRGELDEAPVPAELVDEAQAAVAKNGGSVVSAPEQVSFVYGMNVAAPALANVQLRRAILRAVDRDAVRRQHFPDATTMTGLIGPGANGRRDNACGLACAYDTRAASELMKAAYPNGGVPTVHVDFFTDDNAREAKVAAAIVEGLLAAGIPAAVREHTLAEFQQLVASGGAELFRYGWIGSYPSADAYLSPFELRGTDNVFSLEDGELTALLAKGRSESADAPRTSAYVAAEDRIFALAPLLPLVQYQTTVIARATVRDLLVAPDGSIDVLRVFVTE